jgi:RNA polymerase sigma factor (sigma-70 family)
VGDQKSPVPRARPLRSGAKLSARIARGDREALGEFYEQWFDRMYAMARRLTGKDEAFCLDVVQEAMLRVARSMKPMATDEDVQRWMMRIVHTSALDMLRREARRAEHHNRVPNATQAREDDHDEQIEWVRAQLAALPPEERRLMWLRFELGRTLASAGAAAGMTGDAAHGRIRRVLARLHLRAKEIFDETR